MATENRAILHLLTNERKHVESLAQRLCRDPDDANDLVQETWIRVIAAQAKIPEEEKARRAWVSTITRNVFRSQWRRQKVRRLAAVRPDVVARLYDPHALARNRNEVEHEPGTVGRGLSALINALPDNMKIPLLRVDVGDDSYSDTANALGWPMGTVMSRLHRARLKLRHQLLALERANGVDALAL